MTTLNAPKGTRDLSSPDVERWQFVEAIARRILGTYRYHEIRTPIFEATELFARGIGDHTDIVGKEMYSFKDKGDRSITLRPENTAGVVRAYVEHKLHTLPSPQKFWYLGPMFRYERPQAGRQRQFHQLGVECLAAAGAQADAEVILLASELLAALGLEGLQVQLNSLGCPSCRPAYRERLQNALRGHGDVLCANCLERTEKNPLRVLDCKVPGCIAALASVPTIDASLCEPCQGAETELTDLLLAVGLDFVLNRRLMRGLDYYSRTVFEITSDRLGAQNTVCAGGRYDLLVEELGGPPTPAIGWAIGLERLLMLLPEGVGGGRRLDVYLMVTAAAAELGFRLARDLRRAGIALEAGSHAHASQPWKVGKGLKQAERMGARFALIVGDDELAAGQLTIKDMDQGTQVAIGQDAWLEWANQQFGISREALA